jgi:hypothetical protein
MDYRPPRKGRFFGVSGILPVNVPHSSYKAEEDEYEE